MKTPPERIAPMSPVVLIADASRGIGAATALLAARAGYSVAVNYHSNVLAAQSVASQIQALGAAAIAVQADVADEAQVLKCLVKVRPRLNVARPMCTVRRT